ncbi:MAG TPA: hypothetical protein IAA84_09050 [Candidatus Alectryocaccomicrobium excrementavium]|uniref:PepSY domain-containing protein n=1 Tax=Candidatus Alectryocaccomicrobium excrementavium TaxID=2840668 RepID=A0A9D1K6A5_9FIRM|nr:hypothetical protein [Candidatus Alectryocaccomicrobium excrementavium]
MKTLRCFLSICILFACASPACAEGALRYDAALLETPAVGPVCSYRVEYHEWDAQTLAAALLGEGFTHERKDAFGNWYSATNGEEARLLGIYASDPADEESSGLNGGFTFGVQREGISCARALSVFTSLQPVPQPERAWMDVENLAFAAADAVQAKAEELFAQLGFPDMVLSNLYACTREEIQEEIHAARDDMGYAQYAQQIPECYILFYRQAMDGIALNDVARTDKARSRNDALETYVALIVSENGVESMEAFSLYDVVEQSEPVDTLSCAEALAVLERDLSKGIVQNPLSIVEAELVLYATGNALDGIWLRPIWVFTATEGEADFACYLIDAHTGEICE